MAFTLENQRKLQDAAFVSATALPASNATTASTAFNLVQSFATSEQYAVQVDIDPLANFGTTGSLTITVQDSADNVTFANISELGSGALVIGANTTTVTSDQFRLPPTTRQYIRALATGISINGNITANNFTTSLRF